MIVQAPSVLDQTVWDAVVIGAGPSGAVSARLLAQSGLRTLLIDRRNFPRPKACGGCLNGRSIGILRSLGLGRVLDSLEGRPFRSLSVRTDRGRTANLPLPEGLAVTREALDSALTQAAVDRGAVFLQGMSARVLDDSRREEGYRWVALRSIHGLRFRVAGRVLVAADGLGHPSLRNLGEFRRIRESAWRVGLGTVIPRFRTGDGHHTIQMAIAPEGYVGMVEAERGLCVVAAAVEPRHLRACGDASTAIECILHETKSPIPEFSGAWQGTPALTERLVRPVGWRVVVVGDAAGYVEPFTGEGIAWALTDAATVPRLVHRGLHDWTDRVERDWIRARNRVLGSQRLCRWTRAVVRTGATLDWVLRLTTRYPGLVVRGADRINAMPPGIRCGLQ